MVNKKWITIFSLIVITVISSLPLEDSNVEMKNEVKVLNYSEGTVGDDKLYRAYGRNVVQYTENDKYYWWNYNSGTDYYLYSAESPTGTVTTEQTITLTGVVPQFCVREIDGVVYTAAVERLTGANDDKFLVYANTYTDGVGWATNNFTKTHTTDLLSVDGIDIFKLGSTVYIVVFLLDHALPNQNLLYFIKWDNSATDIESCGSGFYPGDVYDNKYYYAQYDSTEKLDEYYWDGTDITKVGDIGVIGENNEGIGTFAWHFLKTAKFSFCISYSYYYWRDEEVGEWNYEGAAYATAGYSMNSDGERVLSYISCANYLLKIYNEGFLGRLNVSYYLTPMTENVFLDIETMPLSITVHYLEPIAASGYQIVEISQQKPNDPRKCHFQTTNAIIANQFMELYTDAGNCAYAGWIKRYRAEGSRNTGDFVDPIAMDLARNIEYSVTSATSIQAIIVAIVNANCKFLKASTTNVGGATTISNTDFKGNLGDILTQLVQADTLMKVWYHDPLGNLYVDAGTTDSGVDFRYGTEKMGLLEHKIVNRQISRVSLTGKIVSGTPVSVVKQSSGQYFEYNEQYPLLGETELGNIADQILANGDQDIHYYKNKYLPGEIIILGQQITFAWNVSPFSVASDQFYTTSMIYDLLHEQYIELTVSDALAVQLPRKGLSQKVERLDQKINDTKAYVDTENDRDFCDLQCTGYSVGTSAWTSLPLDTEVEDTESMHSVGSNYALIKTAGIYSITANVTFPANATGYRLATLIRYDGSSWSTIDRVPVLGSSIEMRVSLGVNKRLAKNDRIAIQVWQNSGGNLTILGQLQVLEVGH